MLLADDQFGQGRERDEVPSPDSGAEIGIARQLKAVTWLGHVALLLGVAAISSCVTWLWLEYGTHVQTHSPPPVPLTSDLPREIAKISTAFDARVKERFPIGTPVTVMGLELEVEKFVRRDWSNLQGREHYASRYDGGGGVCKNTATIYWKSDQDDRLTSIRGEYQVTCL